MITTAEQQIEFIERYKSFTESTSSNLWQYSEERFAALLSRFREARKLAMEAEQAVASSYNLFSIIKLHFSEVRLHTPILANLLNPKGTHSQGLLFYKHFIESCVKDKPLPGATDIEPYDLYVKDEKVTKWGNIDILIYSRKRGNRFAIIVENKIGARDQYKQLYRYLTYAQQELGLTLEQIRVVYLTLSGKPPDYSGLEPKEKQLLDMVLNRAGYHSQIVGMLENLIKLNSVRADKVKYTIEQYIQILKDLPQ